MSDNLANKIAQAVANSRDMGVSDRPSQGALFAENKKLETVLSDAHPGKVIKVLDKAAFKPTDICARFAELLVDTNTHTLRPDVLKLSASKLSTAMVKQHGSRYAISDKWQSQERPLVAKKSLAISIMKVLDRLKTLKVTLPIPNVDKMSFNDLRKYLLGTGSNQPNMTTLNTLVAFYPDKVMVGKAVWHWRDAFGKKANAQAGSFLQSTTEDKLSMSRLCSMLDLTEEEILRKCYSMAASPA
jgi:hypothetical protein